MSKKEMEVKEKQAIDKSKGEPTQNGNYFSPHVDIFESDDAITLLADVPGAVKEGLDIDLREGVLTLTAKVEPAGEKGRLVYHEYDVGGFMRKFHVGKDIEQGKITAKLDNGVLQVNLPKAEDFKPRKIPVSVG